MQCYLLEEEIFPKSAKWEQKHPVEIATVLVGISNIYLLLTYAVVGITPKIPVGLQQ